MNVTSIEIAPVKLQNRVSSNQLVHVDSGIYYFPQEVLGNVPQFHAISPVISLISTLSETKVLKGFMGTGKRFAIEDVESLQKAQAFYAHHPEIFD
jgi:hypothetical protein